MNNYTRQLAQQAVAFAAFGKGEGAEGLPSPVTDILNRLRAMPDSYSLKADLITKVTDAGAALTENPEDARIVIFLNEVIGMLDAEASRGANDARVAKVRARILALGDAGLMERLNKAMEQNPGNLADVLFEMERKLDQLEAAKGTAGETSSPLRYLVLAAVAAGGYYVYKRQKKTSFAGYFGGMTTGDKIGAVAIVGVIGLGLYRKYSDDKTLAAAKGAGNTPKRETTSSKDYLEVDGDGNIIQESRA